MKKLIEKTNELLSDLSTKSEALDDIVKKLETDMEFGIALKEYSDAGKGTVFTIKLPLEITD